MGWVYLGIFIVLQVIVACIVIYVLGRKLDRELIEAAVEKLSVIKGSEAPGVVIVISCVPLQDQWRQAIEGLIKRKFTAAEVIFKQEVSVKGGVVIEMIGQTLDFSVANRLKNFWT